MVNSRVLSISIKCTPNANKTMGHVSQAVRSIASSHTTRIRTVKIVCHLVAYPMDSLSMARSFQQRTPTVVALWTSQSKMMTCQVLMMSKKTICNTKN